MDETDETDVKRMVLRAVGAHHAAAAQARAEAMADLAATVRHAHLHGLTVAEIARLAQLSRPTVYKILRAGRP
jgi:DNA-directed RNA polymerase specialized sigma24 family protein